MHYSKCEKIDKKEEGVNIIKEEEEGETIRVECRYCKRKFHRERVERHVLACEWASKKRPVFDIFKKRMPLLNEIKVKISPRKGNLTYRYSNSKWQQQHLQLLRNLRVETVHNPNPEYVPCPYCTRKFAPNIAQNHIDICKNILNKPKPPGLTSSPKKLKSILRKNSNKILPRALSVLTKVFPKHQSQVNLSTPGLDCAQATQNFPPFLGSFPEETLKMRKRKKNKNKTVAKTLRKVICSKKILKSNLLNKEKEEFQSSPGSVGFSEGINY